MAAEKKMTYRYMEYLRVLCAFAVILVHVSGQNWFKIPIGSRDWVIQAFYNIAGRFSVCVFCMLTGALFLAPGRDMSPENMRKHIGRILLILGIWTILYDILYTVMEDGDAEYFILHLVKLPGHLWYLLMLVSLYLSTPILKKVTEDRAVTRYAIRLLVVFGALFGLLPGVTGFFDQMAGDSFGYTLWTTFLGTAGGLNCLFVPGYLGFYLLGHYIHEYGLGKWHRPIILLTVPAILLSAVLTVVLSQVTGRYIYTFMLETNPLIVLASAGVYALFRGEAGTEPAADPEPQITEAVRRLGSDTLGIYLIHFAVRDMLKHYAGFTVASYPAILSVPGNALLIFIISLIVTKVLKKVPVVRRIVS